MLGSFNQEFEGLEPRKSGLVPLLNLGALVSCCLIAAPGFHTSVESYKLEGYNYMGCSSD
jgi:hypothetical protein